MNGKTSGFVGGAAQGAAMGASVGGPWGAVIGGVVGGVAGLVSGGAADDAQENQQAWARYNAITGYNTNLNNISLRLNLGRFNANMVRVAGEMNAAEVEYVSEVNAEIVEATTAYNDLLYENDLTKVWNSAGLDLMTMSHQRAVEAGVIEASQSVSGTIMGTGSNADVLIDQATQAGIDEMVVKYNADVQAADISNAKAQSLWKGKMAAEKTRWEGEVSAKRIRSNAAMGAYSILGETVLTAMGDYKTAGSSLSAAGSNMAIAQSNYSSANTQNMVSGLFSAAGSYASSAGRIGATDPTPTGGVYSGTAGSIPSGDYTYGTGAGL